MSNAVPTQGLLDDLESAVQAAWGAIPVSWNDPKLPIAGAQGNVPAPNGYAVIDASGLDISFSGQAATMLQTNQENSFQILGRFPWPSDPTTLIMVAQIEKANLLIGQLQSGPNFGDGGLLPLVTAVDYTQKGSNSDRMYEVAMIFTVVTRADHH